MFDVTGHPPRRRLAYVAALTVCGWTLSALPAPARAQEPSGSSGEQQTDAEKPGPATAERVLKLVREGKEAAKTGEYEKAFEKFETAYDLYPKVELLVRLGNMSRELGRTEEAIEYYQTFVEEASGEEIVPEIRDRIAQLQSSLTGTLKVETEPEGATVEAGPEGRELGETPLSAEFEPGEVEIYVTSDGYASASREVEVSAGETKAVEMQLVRRTETPERPGSREPILDFRRPLTWMGLGAAGAGVLWLGTGVVFSGLQKGATSKVDDYDRSAPGNSPSELEDLKARARARHRTSLIAYSVGATLTAVGAGLLSYQIFFERKAGTGRVSLRAGATANGGWAGFETTF